MVEAVTFDFWNTLCFEERGHLRGNRLDAWAGIFEEAGYAVEREHLEAAMDSTWEAYVRSWRANEQFQGAEAAVHCMEQLGFDVPSDVHAALVQAFTDAGTRAEIKLTPHVADVLADLSGRGIKLAVVCDVGFTASHILRAALDGAGVLGYFDALAFSDEVGVYKPHARIFDVALSGMGVSDPARAAHVGDLRRTDIAGAKAKGMVAVRYMGLFDDAPGAGVERSGLVNSEDEAPEADHVIDDHRQLVSVLGLA